jgi:type I site-specific restriction endonuclease
MDKRSLTERDICTKFILPAVKRAGWDEMLQVREEFISPRAESSFAANWSRVARPRRPTSS